MRTTMRDVEWHADNCKGWTHAMQLHVECVSQSMARTTQPHIECENDF